MLARIQRRLGLPEAFSQFKAVLLAINKSVNVFSLILSSSRLVFSPKSKKPMLLEAMFNRIR